MADVCLILRPKFCVKVRKRHSGAVLDPEQVRQKIHSQHDVVVRQRAQRALGEEDLERKILLARDRRQYLVADQIPLSTERIHPGPADAAYKAEGGTATDEPV